MKPVQRSLVVGADGLIGASLMAHLRGEVVGTSRRGHRNRLSLDLALPMHTLRIDERFDVVYLCAATTSHEHCTQAPAQAFQVNVRAPFELARRFLRTGAQVIFLSTDSVFGPEKSARGERDEVNPGAHAYPTLKAEAERVLMEAAHDEGCADRLAIVRLSKVVSPWRNPFTLWLEALPAGETIKPLRDLILAPISLRYVTLGLTTIAQRRCDGVLHLSAERDVTYTELAEAVAQRLDAADSIRPVSVREAGLRPSYWPRVSRMTMARTEHLTGLAPQSLNDAVEDLLRDWRISQLVMEDSACAIEV